MLNIIKIFISFFILSLSFVSLYSKAGTCPSVETIKRVKGEYLWVTSEPGWTGGFAAPNQAKGRSYEIDSFLSASWVKTHDSADSPGFIQCEYSGKFVDVAKQPNPNYKSDPKNEPKYVEVVMSEVIRFTQDKANGAIAPSQTNKVWSCHSIIKFPNVSCICFGDINKCNFRLA